MAAFEGGLFEEEDGEEKEERCRAAVAFAAKRREKGWRLTHEELYDVRAGGGVVCLTIYLLDVDVACSVVLVLRCRRCRRAVVRLVVVVAVG